MSCKFAGLLPKLDSVAFVNYVTSFDKVYLTETYVAPDFESDLFKDFGVSVTNEKKMKKTSNTTEGFQGALLYL